MIAGVVEHHDDATPASPAAQQAFNNALERLDVEHRTHVANELFRISPSGSTAQLIYRRDFQRNGPRDFGGFVRNRKPICRNNLWHCGTPGATLDRRFRCSQSTDSSQSVAVKPKSRDVLRSSAWSLRDCVAPSVWGRAALYPSRRASSPPCSNRWIQRCTVCHLSELLRHLPTGLIGRHQQQQQQQQRPMQPIIVAESLLSLISCRMAIRITSVCSTYSLRIDLLSERKTV